jgi:uncharacterized protein
MRNKNVLSKIQSQLPSLRVGLGMGFFMLSFGVFAQDNCEKNFEQAKAILETKDAPIDYVKCLALMKPCSDHGEPVSVTFTALLILDGLGTPKDEDLAFKMLSQAAEKKFSLAAYQLGRCYMVGAGCDIDYDKALHWLTIAADQGNEQAAYAIGYSYYKGFGFPQDYKKAVLWFTLSHAPMAKHWLGVCYYYGYGVAKDEGKAITNFYQSQTPNSEMMLKHMDQEVKKEVDSKINTAVAETETETNTAVDKDALSDATDKVKNKPKKGEKDKKIDPKQLKGKWVGKMVELDWSGTQIVRVVPVSLQMKLVDGKINYTWEVYKSKNESTGIWEDNSLYFDKLYMNLDQPLTHNPYSNNLETQILSAKIKFKSVNKKNYLTANLHSFIDEYKEAGPPMNLILKRVGKQEDTKELTDQELLQLTTPTKEFITLYPNPFVNDVLIEYELKTPGNVAVDVYSLNGNATQITLQTSALQPQGKYKYTLDGSKLIAGMYIVRVSVGAIVHTRILIKQ